MENEAKPSVDYSSKELSERDRELLREAKRRAREAHQANGQIFASPKLLPVEESLSEKIQSEDCYSDTAAPVQINDVIELSLTTTQSQRPSLVSPLSSFLELMPPANFSLVVPGIYRSSFPREPNFAFLKQIGIRSILTLVPETYPEANSAFVRESKIRHFHVGMPGNKEPFVAIPTARMMTALKIVLNRRNHPLLIHCNKGKHRTGCVVGCFRKIQHWAFAKIVEEYRDHSDPKSRNIDEQFIDLFDERSLIPIAHRRGFVLK